MTYIGFLERVAEGIAYVTVTSSDGNIEGEFPAEAFKGIARGFKLTIEPLPDVELTLERERQIAAKIDDILGEP